MYEAEFADLYDRFYRGRGKDYGAEAAQVFDIVRRHNPAVSSLLDIACGTGPHLRHFADWLDDVAGLELSASMLEIAARRLPGVAVHQGDMRQFSLRRTFDVVTCMFSSIGHLADQRELDAAIDCFAHHLNSGGMIIVEPWWFPESFIDGYLASDVVSADGQTLCRMSHSVREGNLTRMEIHWVIGEPATGLRHVVEHHTITLFQRHEYERAFTSAGCRVTYEEGGPSGRGLFVAVRD